MKTKCLFLSAICSVIAFVDLSAVEKEIKRTIEGIQTTIVRNSAADPGANWAEENTEGLGKSVLTVNIDRAMLITYFNEDMPEHGYDLSVKRKPIKQAFRYDENAKWLFSTKCEAVQAPNEGVAFIFDYATSVGLGNRKVKRIVTIVGENLKKGGIEGLYDLTLE